MGISVFHPDLTGLLLTVVGIVMRVLVVFVGGYLAIGLYNRRRKK